MNKYSLHNADPVIRTVSGVYFNAFNPNENDILIEDIAHSLAHQCRFGGHLPKYYSVAQHSVIASTLVPDEHRLAALLHDASEAYLIDVPRPIKKKLTEYAAIEDNIMKIIANKFRFQWPLHESVKHADEVMLQKEWDEIMTSEICLVDCWTPGRAKTEFINRFKFLYEQARVF